MEIEQAFHKRIRRWLLTHAGAVVEGLFVALLVLACAWTICFLILQEAVKGQTSAIRGGLERLAIAVATQVDGDLLPQLAYTHPIRPAEYTAVAAPLVRFQHALEDLSHLYAVVLKNGKLHRILDTACKDKEAKEKETLGLQKKMGVSRATDFSGSHSAAESGVQIQAVQEGHVYVSPEPYSTARGTFITALAPIYNSHKKVVGAIGLDLELKGYLKRLNEIHSAGNLGMAIAFVIAAIVGMVIWQTRSRFYRLDILRLKERHARSEVERNNQLLTRALGQIVYHRDIFCDRIDWQGNIHDVLGVYSWELGDSINEWIERIHPQDRKKFYQAGAYVRKQEGVFECEYRIRNASGSYVWVLDRGVQTLDGQGNVVMVDGILLDISIRKRVEDELARMALIVNRTDNAIMLTDPEGRIEWTNRAFSTLTGFRAEEVRGLKSSDFLQGPQSNPATIAKILESFKQGVGCKVEILNYTKIGSLFWVDLEIQPLREPDGLLSGFMALQTDITQRKLVEHELIVAKESAEAAYRARSEFLAVMSHEIRTPLNSMIGFSNLLLHTKLDPQQVEYLEAIHSSGDTLLALLNDILDFSKMESEKLELEVRSTSLFKCIEDVLEVHAQAAAAKGIELVENVDPSLPEFIYADAVRLRQILMNLIGNAIKFTHEGEIIIRVTSSGDSLVEDLWKLVFEVRDTGIGISKDSLSRLFQPFSQADSSTTRRYGGTGLGLAICRKLINQMGGKIWVRSESGTGSSFFFTLCVRAVSPVSDSVSLRKEIVFVDTKIFLLEDNIMKRQALSRQLQLWGATVMACTSLEEAINRIASAGNLKIAIVDLKTPNIKDPQFLPRLAKLFSGPLKIPIILLVPVDQNTNVQTLQREMIVLSKPLRLERLRSVLLKAIASPEAPFIEPVKIDPETPQLPIIKGVRVLVAEDNSVNQKLILRMLSLFHIHADLVETGKACLASLEKQPYDLIFMDVQMPEMDGYEATRCIRENGSDVWIIALTAHALQEDRERSLRTGMNAHLSKPIRLEALRQVIQEFLEHFEGKKTNNNII